MAIHPVNDGSIFNVHSVIVKQTKVESPFTWIAEQGSGNVEHSIILRQPICPNEHTKSEKFYPVSF